MRTILELIRIIFLFIFLGAITIGLINLVYKILRIDMTDSNGNLLIGLAVLILFFVLYRNKLQFSGYYKGEGKVRLSKQVSFSLVTCSFLLLILAPLFR